MSNHKKFNLLRNYLAERTARIRNEWKHFQSSNRDPIATTERIQDTDTKRMYKGVQKEHSSKEHTLQLNVEFSMLQENQIASNVTKGEPFELHRDLTTDTPLPEHRVPQPGIVPVPAFFHSTRVIRPNPETSRELRPDTEADEAESYLPGDIDYGESIDPRLRDLVYTQFPEYINAITKYCRPAGTTDATFRDFNKRQIPSYPVEQDRKEHVLRLVNHFLD